MVSGAAPTPGRSWAKRRRAARLRGVNAGGGSRQNRCVGFWLVWCMTQRRFPLPLERARPQAIVGLHDTRRPCRSLGAVVGPLSARRPMRLKRCALGSPGVCSGTTPRYRGGLQHGHALCHDEVVQEHAGQAEAPWRSVITRGSPTGGAQTIPLAAVCRQHATTAASTHQPPPNKAGPSRGAPWAWARRRWFATRCGIDAKRSQRMSGGKRSVLSPRTTPGESPCDPCWGAPVVADAGPPGESPNERPRQRSEDAAHCVTASDGGDATPVDHGGHPCGGAWASAYPAPRNSATPRARLPWGSHTSNINPMTRLACSSGSRGYSPSLPRTSPSGG